ncbi:MULTISPECIES: GNAT family N-acetyltransferase [Kocuria]|jgi:GNAT superfamily N-acetyltransferase|uniref:GNAT family N-acetyltransferase n=1 Tax=Kocuria TaxID=57493 RepID=UPI00203D29CD|nr:MULTISPECIES: GNAT family N-acetyltransferase [Kocuria]MCM3688199.1 GNAT family N-acetyltransferase [Kocuria rosea]HST72963.1 GNAT family N-acetyltransferase [Kocuria rosea]
MAIEVLPASADRFDDVATVLAPKNPDTAACWCLTYRLSPRENRELGARERPEHVKALCARELPPGVLAYLDGEVAGWAGVAPRQELHAFSRGTRIPHVDDRAVWSVWCFRVRAGYRRRGVAQALLQGAVDFARAHGAPAVEGYPVDNGDQRVDAVMAYVGTRSMFEKAGFRKAADTAAVSARLPRVLMRLELG